MSTTRGLARGIGNVSDGIKGPRRTSDMGICVAGT